ncbi:MAG: 4Fe-4S dicluster domain-containing protein [bacterium]|nr:MAG: 4Fe-4S dicluster domain-containing protein [bacterium]
MAHLTPRSAYEDLSDRLNRFPQGAPPSKLLFQILQMLFTEREAELVARLPIRPFTVEKASLAWKLGTLESRKVLDELAGRGILIDIQIRGTMYYVLPPPMAGFFEFSLMRVRHDIDQKALSELFYQYLNVEEDFIKALFTNGETQLGRTFVHEPVLSSENSLHVLDYERASHVIDTARHIGIGICYCRHKMQHMERACDAPMNICMTFGNTARSLTRHNIARSVDRAEARDLLDEAWERDLVQFGENVQRKVAFICNCCGCCCEAMIAARKFGFLQPVHPSNFLPVVDRETCSGCGKCVPVCPVEAIALVSANDPVRRGRKTVRVDEEICLGCGVCVKNCNIGSLVLESRPERIMTPLTTTRRTVLMAIERGTLQNLLFDNHVLASHRALAAVLGVILNSPPVKRAMAARQIKSRYLRWAEGKSRD